MPDAQCPIPDAQFPIPMFVSGLELWQWIDRAKVEAIESDVSLTELDRLLQDLTSLDKLALRLESFKDSPKIELNLSLAELGQLWERRLQERVPVQYLTGITHWRDFALKVTPAVLIPRPETELLIDLAVEALKPDRLNLKSNWVDLGTGSGVIAIGLASALPNSTIYAVDFSSEALAVAHQNADNCGFGDRIKFDRGSWWEPLEFLKGQVSGMVSNPPYIPTSTVLTLQPEVTKHEPHLALDGGLDGLDCIRHLAETAPDYLESGGVWLVEMMAGQAEAVVEILESQGSYCQVQIFADLAGIDRFALAYRR